MKVELRFSVDDEPFATDLCPAVVTKRLSFKNELEGARINRNFPEICSPVVMNAERSS
jgi:hypothetical protein